MAYFLQLLTSGEYQVLTGTGPPRHRFDGP